jgi:16S rRNA (cytidine1402-2'-O)-methyltransferase
VTDAGTPGVSDPGLELVQAAIDGNITVDPIPGASAPLTALIASGFPIVPFTMLGFAPSRSKARAKWLEEASKIPHTFSFFEAPHRIQGTLREAGQLFGERPIIAARELTKVHQEFLRGTAREVSERLSSARGEFTLIIGPFSKSLEDNEMELSDSDLAREFRQITEIGGRSRRQIVAELAKKSRRSAKEVYSAIERGKKLVI